jgi:hypothetical protein
MRARPVALLALAVLTLVAAAPAAGQDVGAAVADLRDHDVTFEEGAVDDQDVDELDAATARLDDDGTDFKVVVLGEPVGSDFDGVRDVARQVLDGLGGQGRVLVYDPNAVGIASSVDPADEIARAEDAAIDAANASNSFADGALAAGAVLDGGSAAAPPASTSHGGGSSWGTWLLLGLLVLAVLGVVLWLLGRRRRQRADAAAARAELAPAEGKVRDLVDAAGRRVLDLSDRIEAPDAPAQAKQLYEEGADRFLDFQDDLEAADTRAELEAVYPRIVDAAWRLEAAEALLDGRPAPPEPTPEPLFPPAAAPAATGSGTPTEVPPSTRPDGGYRGFDVSPWLTQAAIAAATMLAQRRGRPQPRYREPMGGDVFGDIFGGLGPGMDWGGGSPGMSRRGRPRISLGGRGGSTRGRGMGRRR